MKFRISNEPAFWAVFFVVIVPLLIFSFMDRTILSFGEKLGIRAVFCIFLYVAFAFYILQGGRMYV